MNRLQAAEKRYANLKYLWQQAEIEVADLKVTKNALETQVFSLQQQNADLVAALEATQKLLDDIYAEDSIISSSDLGTVYEGNNQALGKDE